VQPAQRVPGPLWIPDGGARAQAVPAPAPGPAGSNVLVQRDSDMVWVRRPGERADYALPYYHKRERLVPGSMVRTGAGGRAELLWPPGPTSVLLFDEGRVTLGDPERDEPRVRCHALTHALFVLTPQDEIELPGGARLKGDPQEVTGPVFLEHASEEILRLTNQSKRQLAIRYREAGLELAPGKSIDLPLLPQGSGPVPSQTEPERFDLGGFPCVSRGRLERSSAAAGRLQALEDAEVGAQGVWIRLPAQMGVRFSGLSQVAPAPAVDSSGPPQKP